jgi:phosphoglycolate phosphatase
MDVARVSREAYAEAFRRVTGRPLVALPQLPGRSDSEIFFESLALNEAGPGAAGDQLAGQELLAQYTAELAEAFGARRAQLTTQGRLLPGAAAAVRATAALPGVIQTVLTGTIRANAAQKLAAFGLSDAFDLEIGGYGADAYPKGSQLLNCAALAEEKYHTRIPLSATVYLADSGRDVDAARIAGVPCIGVASGRSTVSDLTAAGADLVLTDLSETAEVVAAVDRLTRAADTEPYAH